MFCYNCGAKLEDGTKFCTTCGTMLAEEPAQVEIPAAEAVQQPAQETVAEQPVAEAVVEQVPVAPVLPTNAVMVTNWKHSFFDGSVLGLIGVSLLTAFLTTITLGLAGPAMACYRLRWIYKHTCIGGYRLKFTGKGWGLFGRCLLWGFLTIITIGIFGLWVPIKYKKWEISHVEIEAVQAPDYV